MLGGIEREGIKENRGNGDGKRGRGEEVDKEGN